MGFSINPLTFKSMNISTPIDPAKPSQNTPDQKNFLGQLGDLLNQMASALTSQPYIAGLLNGSGLLQISSDKVVAVSLGVVSTNQNVDCAGAKSVTVHLQPSASLTLTLAHLALGVPVTIWVQSGGTLTFKISATQPGGTAYTGVDWTSASTAVDMTATGLAMTAAAYIAAGSAVPLTNWYLTMIANIA